MAQAQSELDKVFETVINMYDDPADQRDALLELVPAIARKYGNIDSVAAAEWYEKVRHKWIIDDDYTVDSRYDPDDAPMRKTGCVVSPAIFGTTKKTAAAPITTPRNAGCTPAWTAG